MLYIKKISYYKYLNFGWGVIVHSTVTPLLSTARCEMDGSRCSSLTSTRPRLSLRTRPVFISGLRNSRKPIGERRRRTTMIKWVVSVRKTSRNPPVGWSTATDRNKKNEKSVHLARWDPSVSKESFRENSIFLVLAVYIPIVLFLQYQLS